jgi:hypothetical protein
MTTGHAGMAVSIRPRVGSKDRAWWTVLIGLCVLLAAPLLVVDMPPLLDYPNHLARAFVLASLPSDPVLARFYAPHWSIIPNLALDLVAPGLIQVLPVHVAGRLLIAVAVLLPVLGTVAYHRSLGGGWWSLGVGLIAYNSCLLHGFLNFCIGLGLALLLAAAWLRWREDHPRPAIALAIIGALALFACHLMGLIFFAVLIGSAELSRLQRLRGLALPGAAIARLLPLLLIFSAPFALYTLSDLRQLGGDAEFATPGAKLAQLITAFTNYDSALDLTTAVVVACIVTGSLVARIGRFPGPAAWTVSILSVAFVAAPAAWKGTYFLDGRFAIMLAFMLFAGFTPRNGPTLLRHAVVVTITLLLAIRMALLTITWVDHRTDLADLRHVLEPVQPGQAVYVAEVGIQEAPAYWKSGLHHRRLSDGTRLDEHLGALALIEHRAWWPFQFDVPSQQPIETLEPYRTLAIRIGQVPIYRQASVANLCGFDDILLLEADAEPDLPTQRFRLLRRSGFAALYAITQCANGP